MVEEDLESGRVSKKKMKKSRSYSDGFQPYDYSSADYSVKKGLLSVYNLAFLFVFLLSRLPSYGVVQASP